MATIKTLKLQNFKRFKELEVIFKSGVNTIIGDNESGKSSILQAIDMAQSANVRKIQDYGIESLMNLEAIKEFKDGDRKYEGLPELLIEVYLDNCDLEEFDGRNNSMQEDGYGFRLRCFPNEEYSEQINEILESGDGEIPFEFYRVEFIMFGGRAYTYYNKPFTPIFIDATESSHAHARNHLISSIYTNRFDDGQIASHQHEYKVLRSSFLKEKCSLEDEKESEGLLSLRKNAKIEQDLTLEYEGIDITQKGKGAQCEIKAAYALRNRSEDKDNLVLLEEPENHLSHSRTRIFVDKIKNSDSAQVILTSHSSLICSSLGLSECIFLSNSTLSNNKLSELNPDTSDFFTKAPNHNILELILSEKVILVEGHAEYLLCQHLFQQEYGEDMHTKGVHLISVNGLSFKRYLEVAQLLGKQVAVITDNDKSKDNLISKYSDFSDDPSVGLFYNDDEARYTFEVCVYQDNQSICDDVFKSKKDDALDWMLKNKSEASFQLYKSGRELTSPQYIKEAFAWIQS